MRRGAAVARACRCLTSTEGQALVLAIAILASVALLATGLVRAAWDATQSARQGQLRAQTAQAAASASEVQFAVIRRALRQKLVQNILNQGCRQQGWAGTCMTPGYDSGGTSGVRKDRIQQLAQQSSQSWDQLQAAFVDALRQVMPLAPEQDRYRTPAVWGFAGLRISSAASSTIPNTQWTAYGIVSPVPERPILYDDTTRTATIRFEIRSYGWAAWTGAPQSGPAAATSRAQATTYATVGTITMVYPDCPSYWQNPPDQVCQYPESAQVEVPTGYLIVNDPAVQWPAGWP